MSTKCKMVVYTLCILLSVTVSPLINAQETLSPTSPTSRSSVPAQAGVSSGHSLYEPSARYLLHSLLSLPEGAVHTSIPELEEAVAIARGTRQVAAQAEAYKQLYACHLALSNIRLAKASAGYAELLYAAQGHQSGIRWSKLAQLACITSQRDAEAALTAVQPLLQEAYAQHDSANVFYGHSLSYEWAMLMEAYATARHHLEIMNAWSSRPSNALAVLLGKANLAIEMENLEAAIPALLQARSMCQSLQSKEQEAYVLHQLSIVAWRQRANGQAQYYGRLAQKVAQATQNYALLITILNAHISMAEAGENYQAAWKILEKKDYYEAKWRAARKNFNATYYSLPTHATPLAGPAKATGIPNKTITFLLACLLSMGALLLFQYWQSPRIRPTFLQSVVAYSSSEGNFIDKQQTVERSVADGLEKNALLSELVAIHSPLDGASAQQSAPSESADQKVRADNLFIQHIHQLIDASIEDADFSVQHLCKATRLSQAQLFRKVKAITGQNPHHYIQTVRLQRALALLQNSNYTIAEIAYKVGFSDPNYFSRVFHKFFGKTPKSARNK